MIDKIKTLSEHKKFILAGATIILFAIMGNYLQTLYFSLPRSFIKTSTSLFHIIGTIAILMALLLGLITASELLLKILNISDKEALIHTPTKRVICIALSSICFAVSDSFTSIKYLDIFSGTAMNSILRTMINAFGWILIIAGIFLFAITTLKILLDTNMETDEARS